MFITALFTIAKTYNQPKFPWIDQWIKMIWYFIQQNSMDKADMVLYTAE